MDHHQRDWKVKIVRLEHLCEAKKKSFRTGVKGCEEEKKKEKRRKKEKNCDIHVNLHTCATYTREHGRVHYE